MFESTLSAQGLNEQERRVGSLTVAVIGHLAIVVAIVGVTAMIVPPVDTPEVPVGGIVILQPPPLELDSITSTVRRQKKGTDNPGPVKTVVPPRVEDTLSPVPPADATEPAEADPTTGELDGDGHGPRGVENGTDDGATDGTGDQGGGADPQPLTGDMVRPLRLVKVEPAYPEVARKARLGGRVTVQAVIGLDGNVESAEILASTSPLFNEAALDAVERWRYTPALMNGRPVRVYFTVVVDFSVR